MRKLPSSRWIGSRVTVWALVATAVLSQGCLEEDDASTTSEAVSPPASRPVLTDAQIKNAIERIESARSVLDDVLPQIEKDNDRLVVELGRLEPALTSAQADAYAKAFFAQPAVQQRQAAYAAAAEGLRLALDVFLNDPWDSLERITYPGGVFGYDKDDFYGDYKRLANTPEAIGAIEFVERVFNPRPGSPIQQVMPPSQRLIDEVFEPALLQAFSHQVLREHAGNANASAPEKAGLSLLSKVGGANSVLATGLGAIEAFRASSSRKDDIVHESYSLTKSVDAVSAFISIWELQGGPSSASAAAYGRFLEEASGSVAAALKTYRGFVGEQSAPQWTGAFMASAGKISGALGIAFSVMDLKRDSVGWNETSSGKAKMIADVMTVIGGCGAFVSLGPVGGVAAVIGLVAHFAADYFEKKEYEAEIQEEKEQVVQVMAGSLSYNGIKGQLSHANHKTLAFLRNDLFEDKDHKQDSEAVSIQWMMTISQSAFWSGFWPQKHGDELSFSGLKWIKTTFSLPPARVKGLVNATAWSIDDGAARDAAVYGLLASTEACDFAGASLCGTTKEEVLSWLKSLKTEDRCGKVGLSGKCDVWMGAVQRAYDYLKDGTDPDPDGPDQPNDPNDPPPPPPIDGEDDDPNTVSYVHIGSYPSTDKIAIQCDYVRNGPMPYAGFALTTGPVPDENRLGDGYFPVTTPCPRGKQEWKSWCCDVSDPAGVAALEGEFRICIAYTEFTTATVVGEKCWFSPRTGPAVEGITSKLP